LQRVDRGRLTAAQRNRGLADRWCAQVPTATPPGLPRCRPEAECPRLHGS
jgi:hypothetical protein